MGARLDWFGYILDILNYLQHPDLTDHRLRVDLTHVVPGVISLHVGDM